MRPRTKAGWLAVATMAGSCYFQPLDENAAVGPMAIATERTPTVALDTPPIELPEEGQTTDDPCVITGMQAAEILETYCADCHGGDSPGARKGQPPFDFVLDVARLKTAESASIQDPGAPGRGMRFLLPGEPDRSRLYLRVAHGEMPPALPLGVQSVPIPTISDISVLREWITSCIAAP